jgi:Protein of unknown function (DUF3352)
MEPPPARTCARPRDSRYDRGLMPYRAGVHRRWTVRRRARRLRFAGSLIACPLLLGAAGCGSAHPASSGADPARAVPASVAMYAEATVRPRGSLKRAALAAGRTLSGQANPYLSLLGALQTPGSTQLDFKRDVAPWLGPKAGVFLSSSGAAGEAQVEQLLSHLQRGLLGGSSSAPFAFSARGVQGAIVMDTSDAAKARAFMSAQATRAGARSGSYRGVSVRVTAGGVGFGIVDRVLVIGSESALHRVIDTTLGQPSLARSGAYSRLAASGPKEALAHLYLSRSAATPSSASSSTPAPSGSRAGARREGLAALLGQLTGERPANVSLVPSTNSLELDIDTVSAAQGNGGLLSSLANGSAALGELPADSWFAVGLGEVGSTLGTDVRVLRELAQLAGGALSKQESSSPITLRGLLGALLSPLAALGAETPEARREFQGWMRSAGLFASGSGLLDLKGGAVIASSDAARSRAAVDALAAKLRADGGSIQHATLPGTEAAAAARLPGLPLVLYIAAGRNAGGAAKFVIGLGEASVAAVLGPAAKLASAPAYGAAASALSDGITPSITIDFTTLLSVLEAAGLTEDPGVAPLVPYLRALTTLAGGGKRLGGGIERFRLTLGLQAAGESSPQ